MIKKISFGKFDGYHNGKNNCLLVLEIGFREFTGQEAYFTVCGSLWNHLHTDIIRGGQCIDSLANEFPRLQKNPLYMEILDLWKKYHLKHISDIPADAVKRINDIIQED